MKNSKQSFKQGCQSYFEQIELSPAELDRLQALPERQGAKGVTGEQPLYQKAQRPLWLAWAASVFICALALAWWLPGSQSLRIDLAQQIADEVVANHIKLKPLEVVSSEMGQVKRYFTELSFNPFSSQRLLGSWQLEGGRYCSIQGIDAAQLRYTDSQGQLHTQYQVPDSPRWLEAFASDEGAGGGVTTRFSAGYRVAMWREKGVLFANVSAP
ncbi:hypothetical protein ACFSJ3_09970 [Corallincola platygyrae]|uniref:Anti-sigma factor n=1 Tax=Corallincola platygyrae TaxID=1193278 RepID=A0ABW4XMF5_9GAMM